MRQGVRVILTDVQIAKARELRRLQVPLTQIAAQVGGVSTVYIQRLLARFPPTYGRPQRRVTEEKTATAR